MFREMFLVTGLAKYRDNDASSVDALDVLKMATVNGAKAMGWSDCETLSAGSKADIIMIDLNQPNMQPIHNIPKNIVYAGSKQNVKMTILRHFSSSAQSMTGIMMIYLRQVWQHHWMRLK